MFPHFQPLFKLVKPSSGQFCTVFNQTTCTINNNNKYWIKYCQSIYCMEYGLHIIVLPGIYKAYKFGLECIIEITVPTYLDFH